MADATDMDLIREFARSSSEAAFAELVRRHLNLVYSVARRYTGQSGDAQDIAQAVFIILARKAASLRAGTVLTGWLYETTRFTAARWQRTNARRHAREQEAYMESTLNEAGMADIWQQIAPHLEDAMSQLRERDRTLLALRYYENKSGPETAALLGIREDAANKRVGRALEKLRKFFGKRGIDSTAATIAETITANSVQAAPVALAKTVTAVAVAKGATASISTLTLINGALKIMAWTKAKTTVATAAILICMAGVGTGIYIYNSNHPSAARTAAALKAALQIQRPATGTWAYPSKKVMQAIFRFGTNRAAAFPILENAIGGSNAEARAQAIAAIGIVGMPARPELAKFGLLGEPSPDVAPLLWKILNSNDEELSSLGRR